MSLKGMKQFALVFALFCSQSYAATVIGVADGDTLPNLAYKSYGTPKYYPQVAYANKLMSIRTLRTGDDLVFPPARTDAQNQTTS